ncbi:MAG: transcriptional regulator [Candidatus Thorarchaeota archaeon]|jgi:putative transcriptional regulator
MTKDRTQLIQEVVQYLEEAGFNLSSECDVRPSCFDLVARKDNQLLFVKIFANIDALTKDDALALQTVAHFFNATPLIIGKKTRRGTLDEGIVYQRYGLSTIAPRSFHSMISERKMPREFIQRGGRFVAIDGTKLKEVRLSHSMTKKDLAKCVQVSARAILAYERDEMDVSAEVAKRIEKVLETDLVIPIDVLRHQISQERPISSMTPRELPNLENKVNEFFERLGLKVLWTDRAPFHVAAKEDVPPLMSGVGSLKSWSLKKRMEIIRSVSEITESDAVIIVEEGRADENVSELPVIRQLELDDIEESRELKKIIKERSS